MLIYLRISRVWTNTGCFHLYIYKEVLAIHGVSVSEMEDADTIDRRLMIQYDVENNLIRCVE